MTGLKREGKGKKRSILFSKKRRKRLRRSLALFPKEGKGGKGQTSLHPQGGGKKNKDIRKKKINEEKKK